MTNSSQAGSVSEWTEIGEVKITHSIFGKPRVRFVRGHDNERIAWLMMVLLLVGLAALAWLGWTASQRTGQQQISDISPAASEKIHVSAPVFLPEQIAPTVAPPSVKRKPSLPPKAEIKIPVNIPKPAPKPPAVEKNPDVVKKIEPTITKPTIVQTEIAQPAIVNEPPHEVPAVEAAPVVQPVRQPAAQPILQPSENTAVEAIPLAELPVEADTPISSELIQP